MLLAARAPSRLSASLARGAATRAGIPRLGTTDPRMSSIVVHNGTVYLSGQTAADDSNCVATQTAAVLAKTDALLAQAGVDDRY